MPTVRRFGGLRVAVYPNDHRPAHVHVLGAGTEAVFTLNCPGGPPALRGSYGFTTAALNRIEEALAAELAALCGAGSISMAITDADRIAAEARLRSDLKDQPKAVYARYDRRVSRVVVGLDNGLELAFPPRLAEGLEQATPAELSVIEISPLGDALHWPAIDADLFVPGLLAGVFGSRSWIARILGAGGGRSRTAAKTRAARENGRKGGRPKKAAGR